MYNFGAPQKCTSCRLSTPVTKLFVTKFSWVRAGHGPTTRFAPKYYTFELPCSHITCKYCVLGRLVMNLLVNTVVLNYLHPIYL